MKRKITIVTGAGSGIGKAVALAFHSAGYSVVLAGRRESTLSAVADEIRRTGSKADVLEVATDVMDPDSIRNLFERTVASFGRLDVLFNNAGIFSPNVPFEDLSLDQWNCTIQTNLTGAFLCAKEAFKIMKDQDPRGGRIINNGSVSAHAPRPNSAPYTASKHGLTGLTKSLSLDGRKYDIACGQIDIGNAATEKFVASRNNSKMLQANGEWLDEPTIDVSHVANSVVLMANLPPNANVQFMTIMATKMPMIGRG
jgi:NAD(P)-dependent dehydrogenase (short-subunit alcohol dehydrogenase family)